MKEEYKKGTEYERVSGRIRCLGLSYKSLIFYKIGKLVVSDISACRKMCLQGKKNVRENIFFIKTQNIKNAVIFIQ